MCRASFSSARPLDVDSLGFHKAGGLGIIRFLMWWLASRMKAEQLGFLKARPGIGTALLLLYNTPGLSDRT